ncbi:MAG TPA: hypothetical protein VGR16_09590 [Thermomicrobiales bacterium]|nr:hypothetical protein [Thermomicrobiales bacterium]
MTVPTKTGSQHGEATARYTIQPRGPFSLAASVVFLEGFTPAAYGGVPEGHIHLAFVVEGTGEVAGVCATQGTSGVNIDVYGSANPAAVREQTVRILSLDVDGAAFPEVGKRDLVIGPLQERFPGFRPVLFFSPYEAAAWALMGQRIQIVQAAKIKARMADGLGHEVDIHGDRRHTFPSPSRLG